MILLLLITLLCVIVAFVGGVSPEGLSNVFYAYYLVEFDFLARHLVIFIVGIGIVVIFFSRSKKFLKNLPVYIISVILGGSLLGYVLLCIIAVVQLNSMALVLDLHPQLAGMETDKSTIAKVLQVTNKAPEVIVADPKNIASAIATATSGTKNFYGKYALPSIPSFLILPVKESAGDLFFFDNTLVIGNFNAADMQVLSPLIGYQFVKSYFETRDIASYPKVTIMSNEEYGAKRKEEEDKKLLQIDEQQGRVNKGIATISASIEIDKDKIEENRTLFNQLRSHKKITAGVVRQINNNLGDWGDRLGRDQELLGEYTYYAAFFQKQKESVRVQRGNISHELGVFEPNSTIRIVRLHVDNQPAMIGYLETLVHEYLHYASFVSKIRRLKDPFFEEGLTEYFARAVIKDRLHVETHSGYPVQVKIIGQMVQQIPEDKFAEIYFTKDQEGLERMLDRFYGDNFYRDNAIIFYALQYDSDPQEVLKLANILMKKVGGQQLRDKDLQSNL